MPSARSSVPSQEGAVTDVRLVIARKSKGQRAQIQHLATDVVVPSLIFSLIIAKQYGKITEFGKMGGNLPSPAPPAGLLGLLGALCQPNSHLLRLLAW